MQRDQLKPCKWIIGNDLGSLLLGIGTILLGIASLIALYQTSGVLDKILEIQTQATKIEMAVNMLRQQLIANNAINTVNNSLLKNPDATPEQLQKAVEEIPRNASCNNPIYLPQERRDRILNEFQQNRSAEARTIILKNALEYKSPSSACYAEMLRGHDR